MKFCVCNLDLCQTVISIGERSRRRRAQAVGALRRLKDGGDAIKKEDRFMGNGEGHFSHILFRGIFRVYG